MAVGRNVDEENFFNILKIIRTFAKTKVQTIKINKQ